MFLLMFSLIAFMNSETQLPEIDSICMKARQDAILHADSEGTNYLVAGLFFPLPAVIVAIVSKPTPNPVYFIGKNDTYARCYIAEYQNRKHGKEVSAALVGGAIGVTISLIVILVSGGD